MTIHNHSITLRHALIASYVILPVTFASGFQGYDFDTPYKLIAVDGTGRPTRPECAHMGLSDDTRQLYLVDAQTCVARKLPHYGTRVLSPVLWKDIAPLKDQQNKERARHEGRRAVEEDFPISRLMRALAVSQPTFNFSGQEPGLFASRLFERAPPQNILYGGGSTVGKSWIRDMMLEAAAEMRRRRAAVGEEDNAMHVSILGQGGLGRDGSDYQHAAERMRALLKSFSSEIENCGDPHCPIHGHLRNDDTGNYRYSISDEAISMNSLEIRPMSQRASVRPYNARDFSSDFLRMGVIRNYDPMITDDLERFTNGVLDGVLVEADDDEPAPLAVDQYDDDGGLCVPAAAIEKIVVEDASIDNGDDVKKTKTTTYYMKD